MKSKMFYPLASIDAGMGNLTIGTDGTMLYTAYNTATASGEPVTVVLFEAGVTEKSFAMAILKLKDELSKNLLAKADNEPAIDDYMTMLENIKNTGKLH